MAEEVSKSFGIFRGRARGVKVELKDKTPPAYVYEDENLRLEIPVPPLDVFLAFVRELDKLGAEGIDVESSVTAVARAFWLLHQRPRRRGLFRKRYAVPEVDEDAALTLLKVKVGRGDVAVKSLAPAMFGLLKYVTEG
ncbi:MAG: hypothetical protein GTN49_09750 [candidate division Zixibacteria bacterium]|nr:hypothetical protein [candidate division Zixibacteria bacterium]